MKRGRGGTEDVAHLEGAVELLGGVPACLLSLAEHRRELVRVEVPLIELHLGTAGDGGDNPGSRVHPPDRAHSAVRDRALAYLERRPGRSGQRILAQAHRRRAGVRGLSDERHEVSLDAHRSTHRAGQAAAVEQHRPLLDVKLEVGHGSPQPLNGGGRIVEVDSTFGETVNQRDAVRILQPTYVIGAEGSGTRR